MAPLPDLRRMPRLITALVVFLALVLPVSSVNAQAPRSDAIFTIGGVPIEAAGNDPAKARDQALADGEKRAFDLLIRRLVAETDVEKLPPVDPAQIEAMISGFEFESERPSANRYVAVLRVAFIPDQIKAYLRGAGVGFTDRLAPPLLVVALMRSKLGVSALDERTDWRDAWARVAAVAGVAPVVMIKGDKPDQDVLSAEQAFVGDAAAIAKLAERYNVRRVLVAVASGEPEGPFTVSAAMHDLVIGERFDQADIANVAANKLVDAAVRQRSRIEEDWKAITAVSRDWANALDVVVPIKTLEDWIKIRKRLSNSPLIRRADVKALESTQAYVRLEYYGTRELLDRALGQLKLALREQAGQYVIVER